MKFRAVGGVFHPLHICWGSFLENVIFRKGSAHSNNGTDDTDRLGSVVNLIRKSYSGDVPIVLCADNGFADQKAYEIFEQELHIYYITTGKLYNDVTEYVKDLPIDTFGKISKNKAAW